MSRKNGYPLLIVRAIPGVYFRTPINFIKHESEKPKHSGFCLVYPQPFKDGKLTDECREALIASVKNLVQRTGHRRCVVFGKEEYAYVELDGSVRLSNEPPSMTIHLAGGDAEISMTAEGNRITDVSVTPIEPRHAISETGKEVDDYEQ